jgi:hypothetical protein
VAIDPIADPWGTRTPYEPGTEWPERIDTYPADGIAPESVDRWVLQMNGQPTAENTRECGADGDLAGFRNWSNGAHITELAKLWNLEPLQIPHYAPPTHAMQIFRYAEEGTPLIRAAHLT